MEQDIIKVLEKESRMSIFRLSDKLNRGIMNIMPYLRKMESEGKVSLCYSEPSRPNTHQNCCVFLNLLH